MTLSCGTIKIGKSFGLDEFSFVILIPVSLCLRLCFYRCPSVHRGGGVPGSGRAWQGACMVGGVHGRGRAWQEVCMAGVCAWQGGMHGGGHVWQEGCVWHACSPSADTTRCGQ